MKCCIDAALIQAVLLVVIALSVCTDVAAKSPSPPPPPSPSPPPSPPPPPSTGGYNGFLEKVLLPGCVLTDTFVNRLVRVESCELI